ncbi:HIT family protein [Nonomuraea sp. 10N515B]|uniref:HIT family protein n=1 Tax=Nonomuraea sp. 10N515B TaxID=3457422 RepID=UPI003FCEB273
MELFQVVSRITAVAPAVFGAIGTTIFNSNNTPDQVLSHLHMHVVPRFHADNLVIPNPSNEAAPRNLRVAVTTGHAWLNAVPSHGRVNLLLVR